MPLDASHFGMKFQYLYGEQSKYVKLCIIERYLALKNVKPSHVHGVKEKMYLIYTRKKIISGLENAEILDH